mmetsp:Transcript_22539/g.32458  ORF Transcript_22539/g.32458 Transcript_22539/m.32458 type:complete len:82 (-) Transcript_22539:118-363(-)
MLAGTGQSKIAGEKPAYPMEVFQPKKRVVVVLTIYDNPTFAFACQETEEKNHRSNNKRRKSFYMIRGVWTGRGRQQNVWAP